MTIEFSALHLIIGNKSPSFEVLKKVFNQREEVFTCENTHYLISTSTLDNEYFWFHADYGNSLPYSKTVYNIENRIVENNPKTTAQVETAKQLFGLYDLRNKVLYFSNFKKKGIFESFLNAILNEEVVIKAFVMDVDEFCDKIKSINSIKFVAKKNLFNINGDIFTILPNPKDLFGLGMPEEFSLQATFVKANKTKKFISDLKKMFNWKKNKEADSLVCIGFDDNDIETIFNMDTFIQKFKVPIKKNNLGMYDPQLVCLGIEKELIRKNKS